MEITRLNGSFGVRVEGIDLASPGDAEFDTVYELLMKHELLAFPNQQISVEELKRFGAAFGELDIHPYINALPDHPEVLPIIKEANERTNFGGGWHSEVSFYEAPAFATMLYAREVPEQGGDTLVASQSLAFEALSPVMQEFLCGLTAVHSAERVYGPGGAYQHRQSTSSTSIKVDEAAAARVEHPVVRVHPVTGRRSLYVNPAFTLSIKGMTREESNNLLGFLFSHAVRTEFCTRLRWSRDMLVLWDNRATQHYALNDYPGERREMLRVVVKGERPVGVDAGVAA